MKKIINKVLNYLIEGWCHFALKNIMGIMDIGSHVTFQNGFRIYNGARNIKIGSNVELVDALINAGDGPNGNVDIGNDVFFGHGVQVISRGHDYSLTGVKRKTTILEKAIHIEDGVWLGSRTIVLGGVTIGKNSVTAAGSVVTKNIPPNQIFGGVPAKFLKKI